MRQILYIFLMVSLLASPIFVLAAELTTKQNTNKKLLNDKEDPSHDDEGAVFGFSTEQEAPKGSDAPKFPYPIKKYNLVVNKVCVFLTLATEKPFNLDITYGDSNKETGVKALRFTKRTNFNKMRILLQGKSTFINVKLEDEINQFSTVFYIENGKVINPLNSNSEFKLINKEETPPVAIIEDRGDKSNGNKNAEEIMYDTPATARVASSDINQHGSVSPKDTVDYWKFTLSYRAFVNLYLEKLTLGSNFDIRLYQSSDITKPIWSGTRKANASELGLNLDLQPGTYYMKVEATDIPLCAATYYVKWRINKHWPVLYNTRLSQSFTSRHKGLDILPTFMSRRSSSGCLYPYYNKPCYEANTVAAAFSGTVSFVSTYDRNGTNYGRVVYISHIVDGRRVQTRYGHLYSVNVTKGAHVKAGQSIGTMGNTGWAVGRTGVHTHFETRNCYTSTGCTNSNRSSAPVDPKGYFPRY